MPKGKHRITKEKADNLMAGMKARISIQDGPFKGFPEGFIFDVDEVRKLIDHPDAAHFIIRFGWKEEEKVIAPILCVAGKNKLVLEESGGSTVSANTRSINRVVTEEPDTEEGPGGYLDEGHRYP